MSKSGMSEAAGSIASIAAHARKTGVVHDAPTH